MDMGEDRTAETPTGVCPPDTGFEGEIFAKSCPQIPDLRRSAADPCPKIPDLRPSDQPPTCILGSDH